MEWVQMPAGRNLRPVPFYLYIMTLTCEQ